MSYPGAIIRVSWGFAVANTDEVAQTSLIFADPATPSADYGAPIGLVTDADCDNLLAAMSGLLATFLWADYSQLVSLKVAVQKWTTTSTGTGWHYSQEPKIREGGTPSAGGSSNVFPQLSPVLSLRSGSTLGKANYGRMYIPHARWNLPAGQATTTTGTALTAATAGATFIDTVNTLMAARYPDVQASIVSTVGTGTVKGVTRVGMGVVLDTQRRRRSQLEEQYQFATV